MLGVGDKFPEFKVKATVSTDMKNAFKDLSDDSYPGKWKIYFFWPKDFTFVCPTEIVGFGKLNSQFLDRDTQVIGGSTDSNSSISLGAKITQTLKTCRSRCSRMLSGNSRKNLAFWIRTKVYASELPLSSILTTSSATSP